MVPRQKKKYIVERTGFSGRTHQLSNYGASLCSCCVLISRLLFNCLSHAPDLKRDIPVVIRELLDNFLHWPPGTGVKQELSVPVPGQVHAPSGGQNNYISSNPPC